jgi:hypothetical protein
MADTLPLETNLNDLFGKSAPALPNKAKNVLTEWAPWLALIGGLLSLWAAWALWNWAHTVNQFVDYANSLSALYGGSTVSASRLSAAVWLGIIVLAVEGVLYLLAFPGLRDHKKSGWNLLYWGALVNIAYGIVVMFTDYGGVGSFIMSLIGSAIGFYLLFQIRGRYTGVAEATTDKPLDAPKAEN